jgi:hypothetical protein
MKNVSRMRAGIYLCSLFLSAVVVTACSGNQIAVMPTPTLPPVTSTSTPLPNLPTITSVNWDRNEVPRYESIEFSIGINAEYSNPYDWREVTLDAVMLGPNGESMNVPGFWDGEEAWKIRFTPPSEGIWTYHVSVTDSRGQSLPNEGEFTVLPSDLHGWIIPGDLFDPAYSGRYLLHHDGTPFYGIGHCDALDILIDGFDMEDGVGLFDDMKAAGENYVVWWPMYTNSIVGSSYEDYSIGNMNVIDAVVKDAEKEAIYLVFTIWDHPNLRDDTHAWPDGNWNRNGFSKLGDIDSFFVSDEAWAWQQNLYRYIVARWGYSPAIALWQTVSEINGTNSYDQTDSWHKKVNDYFVTHDPYRHPTTASGSGEVDWPTGHMVMDAPQVHLYDWKNGDVISAAQISAEWTSRMWERAQRPNWIGEFGVTGNSQYPELFHHAVWAALASGAAMTPAEWNSGGAWGRLTPEMKADLSRLAMFVSDLPLAKWNPSTLVISSSDSQIRGWGVSGRDGGLFWVQDFSLEGQPVDVVRSSTPLRTGVQLEIQGMPAGMYTLMPFDTWQGKYLDSFDIDCAPDSACTVPLPDFTSDMAFKIIRK